MHASASAQWAWTMYSALSAMSSREGRLYNMPSCPMVAEGMPLALCYRNWGLVKAPGATMEATKSYEEIIDFIAAGSTPEAVVAFHPSDRVQQRVAKLVEGSKDGSISVEEQSELDDYLQLEHIMIMAKARARMYTQLGK
jgi:hypothetical protein